MALILAGRGGLPIPPAEIADEVELYARESGRHGTLRFVPTRIAGGRIVAGTWTVRLTLRPSDKRLKLYQEGKAAEPPAEVVWLHEDDGQGGYRALNLTEMGASGVRRFLERGNTWGRGEFRSLEEHVRKVNEQNEQARQKNHAAAKDGARTVAREWRRRIMGLPLVRVLTDLPRTPQATTQEKDS